MSPEEHLNYLVKGKFGAEAARTLCQIPGTFSPGEVYTRDDINKELRDRFVKDYGGSAEKNDVIAPIKKWLTQDDCPFEKVARGRYRFVSDDSQDDTPGLPGVEKNIPTAEDPSKSKLKPEIECGKGPCEVYAWYLPLYRQHSNSGCWPTKIGYAGLGGFERRMRDFAENLPELPAYLLRMACKDEQEAKRRESLLHAYFIERGKQIEVRGKEWFQTNPEEIEDAIDHVIPSASNVEAPAIEDTITRIFKDVPAGEWANLPEDLTDKLDQYLYGAEE